LAHIPGNLRKIVTEVFIFNYLFIYVLKMREKHSRENILAECEGYFSGVQKDRGIC